VRAYLAVAPSTTYHYTIGAAGAGAAGAAGGDGGDSTFTVGATVVTAYHGHGGAKMQTAPAIQMSAGGLPPAQSTSGSLNGGGASGQMGHSNTNLALASGAGGASSFGGAGGSITAVGTGLAATGYGSGGGGAAGLGTTGNQTGGAGSAGCWIVREYS
jgi:hypothetical protein